jgi:hypothetical protein
MRFRVDKRNDFREILCLCIHEGMSKYRYNLCFAEQEMCEDTRKFVYSSFIPDVWNVGTGIFSEMW